MKTNLSEIQEQFDKVICYSQNLDKVNTTPLLQKWEIAKSNFIERMDGELVYEYPTPVTITLSTEARDQRIEHFLATTEKISSVVTEFLYKARTGLYENKTCSEITVNNIVVPAGLKIGKALHKYFSDYCDKNKLEWIIQELSRIIQENSVTGKLCFSVHPLDFLSASENTHKWRSCHALDGEYRAGNLSYMCDEVTAMVYIKSEQDDILPNFPDDVPWNNKKWRCFLYFDKARQLVWAGRQYPFATSNALNKVTDYILEKFKFFDKQADSNFHHEWENKVFNRFVPDFPDGTLEEFTTSVPYIYINAKLIPLDTLVRDHTKSYAFNDLLYSNFYVPVYIRYGRYYSNTIIDKSIPPLTVGGDAPCVYCGENSCFDSSTMLCARDALDHSEEDIEGITRCVCCGCRILEDGANYYEGDAYCDDCYQELDVHYCANCDREFSAVANEETCIDNITGNYYCCPDCYTEACRRNET